MKILIFIFSIAVFLSNPLKAADATKGQALYVTCAACHGDKGQGNAAMKSPKIAGQFDWYLITSIQKYRDGLRGKDPKDQTGMMMAGMVGQLTDEQIADIVAYISTFQ